VGAHFFFAVARYFAAFFAITAGSFFETPYNVKICRFGT
jgi:hypothetical protein